jgi:hypothetical protein
MPDENQHIYKKGEINKIIHDVNMMKLPRECVELRKKAKRKRNKKVIKDESVHDENLEPKESRLQPENLCVLCGFNPCVCDERYERLVDK